MNVLLPGAREIDLTAVLEHYREHGYARVGSVIEPAFLDLLRRRAEDIMLGRITVAGLFFQHDSATGRYEDLPYGQGYVGPSLAYRKIEKLERDDAYRALLDNALFERIVRAVLGRGGAGDDAIRDVSIYRAVLFGKAARASSPIPWHQDGGLFWGLDRDPELQIWTALDDAGLGAGCLEVIPGSHEAGLATRNGGVVPAAHVDSARAEERAVPLPATAGDVILVHNMLWHRSGPNTTDAPRRAFTVCYMSAETRCLRKKHAPREFVRVFRG